MKWNEVTLDYLNTDKSPVRHLKNVNFLKWKTVPQNVHYLAFGGSMGDLVHRKSPQSIFIQPLNVWKMSKIGEHLSKMALSSSSHLRSKFTKYKLLLSYGKSEIFVPATFLNSFVFEILWFKKTKFCSRDSLNFYQYYISFYKWR